MSLKDLFETNTPRVKQQDNWLRMVAAIPGAKRALNNPVIPEDEAVATEAKSILFDSDRKNEF